MSSPVEQTTDVDVDAVPEVTVEESRAPAGSTGSPLPAVGTNAVSEWAMWDPNLWWTDWSLPPDPRPSWEQWFDWVNQLQALTPALGEAGRDWQTMIGQFDESLRAVRAMRADLADWTGPSAQTMSEALDRLEDSISTKSAAIQNNPARLEQLAQTINEAVPPMAALDAEYQQVLQDLAACRQVAERGRPIMLNLATELLQVGTDLENSVRTDNLAPQPVPPRPLTLTDGPQGPTQQLTQVAGPSGLADPGVVTSAAQVPVAEQPGTVGVGGLTDPGQVVAGQAVAPATVPGVTVGATGVGAASPALPTDATTATTAVASSPALAGVSAGTAAPTLPPPGAAPTAAPAPTMAASGPALSVAPALASGSVPLAHLAPATGSPVANPVSAAMSAPVSAPVPGPVVAPSVAPSREREDDRAVAPVVRVPAAPPGVAVSGATGVPAGLRGRTGGPPRQDAARDEGLDDVFRVGDAGTGTVTAPR